MVKGYDIELASGGWAPVVEEVHAETLASRVGML